MKLVAFVHKERTRLGALRSSKSVTDLFAAIQWQEERSSKLQLATPEGFLENPARALKHFQKLLEQLKENRAWAKAATLPLAQLNLLPPIPNPPRFFAVAANYRKHIKESGYKTLEEKGVLLPQFFIKPNTTLVGHEGTVHRGKHAGGVDWEVELGVVIGKRGRDVPLRKALDYVLGYTIIIDVTDRLWNSKLKGREYRQRDEFFDWLAGKWRDTYGPCGPCLVTADEIPDPQRLRIRLRRNGELRQNSSTKNMIHSVRELVHHVSRITELQPGDLISTGTPDGVGKATGTYLKRGDQLTAEIQKVGSLRVRIQ